MENKRFSELKIKNKIITNSKEIEIFLSNTDHFWLLDCELDNVKLEIIDDIIYWNNGIFYYGDWKWGVWNNGEFRGGRWFGGIFYNGVFNGEWINGVKKGGEFK